MSGNSIGKLFRLTTFGESHGLATGGVIEGCPPGLMLDESFIRQELQRRRPGQSPFVSPRNEKDEVIFASGIFEGLTTGAPIVFWVFNADQQSSDYEYLKDIYRPSHADRTYELKYSIRDHRGGGRASARETLARVVGGAVAKLFLLRSSIKIRAYVSGIGPIILNKTYHELDLESSEENPVRCPDPVTAKAMMQYLKQLTKEKDSTGGIITCVVQNVPTGLGEPVFDKLQAALAHAVMSIPAVKGFAYGSGFEGTHMKGSEHNDLYFLATEPDGSQRIRTLTNHSGGILGGISSGEDIYFTVAFKPIATIGKEQSTVDKQANQVRFTGSGRHDPCPVPRAVVIVEAMTALVLADHCLLQKRFGNSST